MNEVTSMKQLIIIPAFNEEDNIIHLIDNVIQEHPQYDYIIINDCSTDRTEQICRNKLYNYITIPINLGIGGAVQCGYRYAFENGYDIAIQLDGDGQHNPEYIKKLLEPIFCGKADMVIGSRFITNEGFQTTIMRRIGISLIKIVIKLCCGTTITDTTSGFRAVNRKLIELFAKEYAHDYPEPEAIVTAVLNGYKVIEEPVIMNERIGGSSSINTLHSVYYMFKVPLALIIYRLSVKKRNIKKV